LQSDRTLLYPLSIDRRYCDRTHGNKAPTMSNGDFLPVVGAGGDGMGGEMNASTMIAVGAGNRTIDQNRFSFPPSISSTNSASTNTSHQQSSLFSSSLFSSGNSTNTSSVTLPYPHNFFDLKLGQGPKNADDAAKFWQYRKHRPASGTVDTELPDGEAMMVEINGMRSRLKTHIENAFMKDARLMADSWKLKVPMTNQTPVTTKDLVAALCALERVEGSVENERIVYMVCHHFHHQRSWVSTAVDAWCHEEKIRIEFPPHPDHKRANLSNRGGFGVYARSVKSEIVKLLMRNMLSKTGWCIATKDNSKQNSKQGQAKRYEAISIRIPQSLINHTCYVVTKEESAKEAPGKNKDGGSATMGSSADNAIDVDKVVGFGAHLCSTLGVAMSTEQLQDMWKTYQPPGNVIGLHITTGDRTAGEDISSLASDVGPSFPMRTTIPQQPSSSAATTAAPGTHQAAAPVDVSRLACTVYR